MTFQRNNGTYIPILVSWLFESVWCHSEHDLCYAHRAWKEWRKCMWRTDWHTFHSRCFMLCTANKPSMKILYSIKCIFSDVVCRCISVTSNKYNIASGVNTQEIIIWGATPLMKLCAQLLMHPFTWPQWLNRWNLFTQTVWKHKRILDKGNRSLYQPEYALLIHTHTHTHTQNMFT